MTTPAPLKKPIKPVNPLNKTTFMAKQAIIVSSISAVIAIIAIVVGTLNYQSLLNKGEDIQQALQHGISTQTTLASLSVQSQNQFKQLSRLQDDVRKLENNQDIPLQKTLAEVSYLIHLANLHLTVDHDSETALSLLVNAKQHLAPVHNTSFIALKQALSSDIQKIQNAPAINVTQLYRQIDKVSQAIAGLSTLPNQPTNQVHQVINTIRSSDTKNSHWYDRVWHSIKQTKDVFVIHRIQNSEPPVTAPDKIFYIQQNIRIKLTMAQWALLHQKPVIYQDSLQTVSRWLTQYFSLNTLTQPLITEVNQLATTNIVSQLPALKDTLEALSHIHLVDDKEDIKSPPPKVGPSPASKKPENNGAPKNVTTPNSQKGVEI